MADRIRRNGHTRGIGYTRIEASRAGRHLPRPYGERDMGLRMTRVCWTRGRTVRTQRADSYAAKWASAYTEPYTQGGTKQIMGSRIRPKGTTV